VRITRKRVGAVIPLASTADVAFLLLIFFIVLAKGTNEAALDVRPAVTTEQLDATDPSMVTVSIDRESKVYVNGTPVAASAVKDAVNDHLGELPAERRKVLMKIDKGVPERVFGKVMLDVSESGADIWRALDPHEQK
jgi:biopolymer transport protein ExbD